MKKLFTFMMVAAFTLTVFAQTPRKMSYQAVVRNPSGMLITNQAVGMKVSILQGSATGTVVYSETYSPDPQTNTNGLVTVEIGNGTPVSGTFTDINWAAGPFYLKMEIDPDGGTGYTITGTSQLLSVPYALYSASAGNVFSGNYNDLTDKPFLFSGSYDDLTNKPLLFDGTWNSLAGKPAGFADDIDNVDDADNSITNEIQELSLSGTVLSLSKDGGSVTLPSSGGLSLPYNGTTDAGTYAFRVDHTSASESTYAGIFSSTHGTGLLAESYGGAGLFGTSHVPGGVGVFGMATVQEEEAYGVYGTTESIHGTGVHGAVHALDGVNYGVRGEVASDAGFSGYFEGGRFYIQGHTGIGINNPEALLHTQGMDTGQGNVLFVGQYKDSDPAPPPLSGPGTRMMWYPDKAAFRAGHVEGDQWDMDNIGNHSIALGYGTMANGQGCVALGFGTHAGGQTSTAMGNNTVATGWSSAALGSGTIARSDYSTAIGFYNVGLGTSIGDGEWIPTDPVFEIGIGSSETSRANALTVLKNGNVGIGKINPLATLDVNGIGLFREAGCGIAIIPEESSASIVFAENNGSSFANIRLKWAQTNFLGNVGINNTDPQYDLDINGQVNIQLETTENKALLINSAEALWYNNNYFSWGYGGNWNYFADKVFIGPTAMDPGTNHLVVNGSAAKPGGGSWATWSDERLKDIHGFYSKGLEEIIKLQPVSFSYREENPVNLPDDEEYAGLVAQKVQEVFPEAVTRGADGYLQLDIHPVNIALINAVKELKAENDRLKSENEQIISRLSRLEKLLEQNGLD